MIYECKSIISTLLGNTLKLIVLEPEKIMGRDWLNLLSLPLKKEGHDVQYSMGEIILMAAKEHHLNGESFLMGI